MGDVVKLPLAYDLGGSCQCLVAPCECAANSGGIEARYAEDAIDPSLAIGSPVTLKVTGVPGLSYGIYWDPTGAFRSESINQLSQAGVPAESIAVEFSLGVLGVERSCSATIVTRSSETFDTRGKIANTVSTAMAKAVGNPVTVTITNVGNPRDTITPASGASSWFDHLLAYLQSLGSTLGSAVKWIAVLLLIGLVAYLLISSGALKKVGLA